MSKSNRSAELSPADYVSSTKTGVATANLCLVIERKSLACRRSFLWVLKSVLIVFTCFLLPAANWGQTPSSVEGIPPHTIEIPVPLGFVSATTGHLHLEIPLASLPERHGDPVTAKLVYDSQRFTTVNGSLWGSSGSGWRFVVGPRKAGSGTVSSSTQETCAAAGDSGYPIGSVTKVTGLAFTDIDGTYHPTANIDFLTRQYNCQTTAGVIDPNPGTPSASNIKAVDGSGYTFQVSNFTNITVTAPDGTLVYDNTGDSNSLKVPVDTNGNFGNWLQGSLPDTFGRNSNTITGSPYACPFTNGTTTPPPASGTLKVSDSTGTQDSYIGTCTNVHVSEVVSGTTQVGTESLLTSLKLPNNTTYTFTYDTGTTSNHLGDLTSVTLPSGGTITFTHIPGVNIANSIFDAGYVSSIAYGGGTWNLSYAQDPTSLVTTTTMMSPSRFDAASGTNVSDKTVFTTKPNQPYLANVVYYNGSTTPLKTIVLGYDGNFLPTSMTTTLNDTNQTSQITLQYFGGLRDYISQKQETDFSGTVIRTTVVQYNGPFNKPTSVNVYAGASTTGTPFSSTKYFYDNYAACKNGVPGLAAVTGAPNHLDSAYGVAQTARGNITSIQRLISGTTYATTFRCYDTLGNITQEVDPNGNPTTYDYSGVAADTHCITASASYSIPTTITNALGQRLQNKYYSCTGLKGSQQDENDLQASRLGTTFTYDILGRLSTVSRPDGGSDSYSYSDDLNPTPPFSMSRTTSANPSPNIVTTTIFDGLSRVTQTQIGSGTSTETIDTTYDAFSRVASQSNPHLGSPQSTDGTTSFVYDALGRNTKETKPDASIVSQTYTGNCVITVDEAASPRQSCYDALGRLTNVVEDPTSKDPTGFNFPTTYFYDVLDNLTKVDQNASRTRTFGYDGLSRLTCAATPESATGTCTNPSVSAIPNTTFYGYDNNGNILQRVDARGTNSTINYTYDALNRLTRKSYLDGTPTATYVYDFATDGFAFTSSSIGRMTKASTAGTFPASYATATYFAYDPVGRVTNYGQCVFNAATNCGTTAPILWLIQNAYDLAGHRTNYTDANNMNFTQAYDGLGRAAQLQEVNLSTPLTTLIGPVTYYPGKKIHTMLLGNGLTQTTAYNNRLEPCDINLNSAGLPVNDCHTTITTGNVQDFALAHNQGADNGNLSGWVASGVQNFSRSYTYDKLNRLKQYSDANAGQSCKGLQWAYDEWGNRTTQAVTAGTCNNSQVAFLPNNQIIGTYTYDTAGDITFDGTHHYTYDAERRITKIDAQADGTAPVIYVYDALGHRVAKGNSETNLISTFYIYTSDGSIRSERDGSNHWIQSYFSLDGQPVGLLRGTNTGYLFQDQIGSTRLVTLGNQCVFDSMDFLPFGEQIAGGTATSHKFTGQERDDAQQPVALDYFRARYFSANQGRFMTADFYNPTMTSQGIRAAGLPDALAQSSQEGFLVDPQQWNAYSYGLNNPLRFLDPTGAAPSDHHLIPERDKLGVLGQAFAEKIKTGPLSGNGYPNSPGFNRLHRAYNTAVKALLDAKVQEEGPSEDWSVKQWKDFSNEILESEEPAIQGFLEELEENNPGARASLVSSIATFTLSAGQIAKLALQIEIERIWKFLNINVLILCVNCNQPINLSPDRWIPPTT